MATPSIITPGPTPQPIIIQYDAAQPSKHLYGSGEQDEGFTLEFANLDNFHAWKEEIERTDCVDYFKVDAHTSKAVPPRFKVGFRACQTVLLETYKVFSITQEDFHAVLNAWANGRVGQKKYVKKFPDRPRKTPSKKASNIRIIASSTAHTLQIEGVGCPSTISYKTYHDSPVVRVNYVSNHSHEIGAANLPFTKKYRKQVRRPRLKGSSSKTSTKASTEIDDDGDSASLAGPDAMSFTSVQIPPSPPASSHEGLDMGHLDVPYGPMPRMSYEQPMANQSTSSTVSQSHQPQPQSQPQPQPQPQPRPQSQPQPQQQAQIPHQMNQRRPDHLYLPGPQNPQMQDPSRTHMGTPLDQTAFSRQRQHSVAIHTPTHESAPPHPTQSLQQFRQQHHDVQQLNQQAAMSHQHSPYQPHHLSHPHHPPVPLSVSQPQPPPPHQQQHQPQPPTQLPPSQPPSQPSTTLPPRSQLARVGWDQLAAMFEHIRRHQAIFDYNHVGIRSLEQLLIRLYLETPPEQETRHNQDPQR
ncbi:hypothetical protein FRC17_002145 [Serendipita sp. 399]|nr:hypothetical protein FRC17_002145 [Serendipita sp. 399]